MIPSTKNRSTVNGYVNKLREQIHYLRACAPQASILFIGPSDMSTRINGVLTTYPMVPYMDEQLALMAQEEQIAYWSMYKAMGGKGSMISWRSKGLAGSDYVHFTRKGASKVGKLLYEWLQWEQQPDNGNRIPDNGDRIPDNGNRIPDPQSPITDTQSPITDNQ